MSSRSFALAASLLLAACATNKGDFGLNDVHTDNKQQNQPKYQDEKTEPRTEEETSAFMQPGLGVSAAIPRRAIGINKQTLNEPHLKIETDNLLSTVPVVGSNGEIVIPHTEEIRKHPSFTGYLAHSHDGLVDDHRKRNLRYVRSGWVMDPDVGLKFTDGNFGEGITRKILAGQIGYVYYQGIMPSQSLPTAQNVQYKGTWDFVTDALERRPNRSNSGQFKGTAANAGNWYGATSFNEADSMNTDKTKGEVGHSSEFTVNFADKTVSGSLYKNNNVRPGQDQVRTKRYAVEAKLKGNRIQGKATAQDTSDPYFGKNADLEGGFFGPNAEEMAGKFLAEDNSLFGVFAAKRPDAADIPYEKIIDDFRFNSNTMEISHGDNFGDARQLFVNGKLFPLMPSASGSDTPFAHSSTHDLGDNRSILIAACCSNTDYLKFGSYQTTDNGSKGDTFYFLQGERTPSAKIPASGEVRYQGSWQAHILSKNGLAWGNAPDNREGGNRAVFDVDFAEKTLTGTLTADNRTQPSLHINARLESNGFSGTAKTGTQGFVFDPGSTGQETRVHLNAQVQGGFYGPDAAELGGVFHSRQDGQDQVGGSFGAKRQVLKP